ncbi:unnamed protein product [Echinostoma caproni]|uniref:Uncharacterized protein n=1 Tax=Echinostoma caproni TaxID=27848 RepID=A0A3P8KIM1_9TREM|nr:unnamed protein product [Echinostoma caproni]
MYYKNQPVSQDELTTLNETVVRTDLQQLKLPDKILEAFYRSPKLTFKSIDISKTDGRTKLRFGFPKRFFDTNEIDPSCNLHEMLQWGFANAVNTKGYHFGSIITIQTPDVIQFIAMVRERWSLDKSCEDQTQICEAYRDEVRRLITTALYPVKFDDSSFTLTALPTTRTERRRRIAIHLELDNTDSFAPHFDSTCPTLIWSLNEAFVQLINVEKTGVFIEELISLTNSTTTIQVSGTLKHKGMAVAANTWKQKNTCTVMKQLANLKVNGSVFQIMYTYGLKRVTNFQIVPDGDTLKVQYVLRYPKSFFVDSKINPNCDFVNQIEWALKHTTGFTGYHLGEDIGVKSDMETLTQPFEIEVLTKSTLKGTTCTNPLQPCTPYRAKLCEIIQGAFACELVPPDTKACQVYFIPDPSYGLRAEVTLQLSQGNLGLYPIDINCPTYGAIFKKTFTDLYGDTGVTIVSFPGQLNSTGECFREMPDAILTMVYTYGTKEIMDLADAQGKVNFKVSYPKSYFVNSGIDPTCNLAEMLQWGFRNTQNVKSYHLGKDATVTRMNGKLI